MKIPSQARANCHRKCPCHLFTRIAVHENALQAKSPQHHSLRTEHAPRVPSLISKSHHYPSIRLLTQSIHRMGKDSTEKKTQADYEESNKDMRIVLKGNRDTTQTLSTIADQGNDMSLNLNLNQDNNDGTVKVQDEKHPSKEKSTKPKKPTNSLLQPIQRSRKRNREKKRRLGITVAMKGLHDILAKINMEESQRIQMPTQEDSIHPREEDAAGTMQATAQDSNWNGYHQLGQREIIIDAVNTLSHLHSENERNKTEILQLTASLQWMQRGPVSNTAMLHPIEAAFNPPMPPLQQYMPTEQAPQDSVFSAAMLHPIEAAFNPPMPPLQQYMPPEQAPQDSVFSATNFPSNPNVSSSSQPFPTDTHLLQVNLEQQYSEAMEHMYSSNLTAFNSLPKRLLDDELDNRGDDNSTDLIDGFDSIGESI